MRHLRVTPASPSRAPTARARRPRAHPARTKRHQSFPSTRSHRHRPRATLASPSTRARSPRSHRPPALASVTHRASSPHRARARDALKRIGVGVTAHPPARRRFVVLVVVEAYLLSERRVAQRRTRSRERRPSRHWESLHFIFVGYKLYSDVRHVYNVLTDQVNKVRIACPGTLVV